jgi:hypothetical protein
MEQEMALAAFVLVLRDPSTPGLYLDAPDDI